MRISCSALGLARSRHRLVGWDPLFKLCGKPLTLLLLAKVIGKHKIVSAGNLLIHMMSAMKPCGLLLLLFLFSGVISACAGGSSSADSGAGDSATLISGLRSVDITVVYPLPPAATLPALMSPDGMGRDGPLLPHAVFDGGTMPELDERSPLPSDAERWASLRVVAVRFDPCPGVTLPPPSAMTCAPDLRLVFQSLRPQGDKTTARDGAVHAFYALSRAEFVDVLHALRALRAQEAAGPQAKLDVHPRLTKEGVDGDYAQKLKAIVLAHAGAGSIVRVTSFRRTDTHSFGQKWAFRIREKKQGVWGDSLVATTGTNEQSLVAIVGGRWDAQITPALTHPDDVTRVFKVSTPDDQRNAFRATAHALSPRIHTSESLDCATCHIAPDVAGFVQSTLGLNLAMYPEHFTSSYPLDSAALSESDAIAFENIHMLSYLDTTLSVTPRVANETAALLELLNSGTFD